MIESGLILLIAGIALLIWAYLLPGMFMAYDHKEGIKLLEEKEAALKNIKPMSWILFVTAIAFWPFVDWERIGTHQNWAMYIKKEREKEDDSDSDGFPTSDEKDRESSD